MPSQSSSKTELQVFPTRSSFLCALFRRRARVQKAWQSELYSAPLSCAFSMLAFVHLKAPLEPACSFASFCLEPKHPLKKITTNSSSQMPVKFYLHRSIIKIRYSIHLASNQNKALKLPDLMFHQCTQQTSKPPCTELCTRPCSLVQQGMSA